MSRSQRVGLLLVVLLLASACSSSTETADSLTSTTAAPSEEAVQDPIAEDEPTAPSLADPTAEEAATATVVEEREPTAAVAPERPVEAASWALVDAVPAYRKNGVFIKSGLVYSPVLNDEGHQTAAELRVEAEHAALAIVLNRFGQVPFDQVQFNRPTELADTVTLSAFVVTGDNQVFVFSEAADFPLCTGWAAVTPLTDYGIVDHFDQAFDDLAPTCLPVTEADGSTLRIGTLPEPQEVAVAFGILIDSTPDSELPSFALDWLALTDSSTSTTDETLHVRAVGLENALASRTEDPDDDVSLQELTIEEYGTGVTHTIAESEPGEFTIDVASLGTDIVQISMNDYGQQMFPYQGAWVDLGRLRGALTIDFSPEFEFELVETPKSERSREPHRLSIWNGSTARMEFHEYRGLTFSNNEGNADRDRTRDNPNGCRRVAILGGSWIEAIQTRVDQKPGVIAEGILDSRLPGCYEIFTFGRDTFSPENQYPFAQQLVEEFGVELLILGISRHNLCRMDDEDYIQRWEVALETPLRWRLINGEMVEPFSRREATNVEPNPDFATSCTFRQNPPEGTPAEVTVVQKAADLVPIFSMFGDGVEVRYLNIRDVYRGSPETALQIQTICAEIDLVCPPVPVPTTYEKPEGIDDHSPFLYRYRDDDHPNIRANQNLGRDLAVFVEEALESQG